MSSTPTKNVFAATADPNIKESEDTTNYTPRRFVSEQDGRLIGRASSGLYPLVNRTDLAAALGKHPSLISNYFTGRVKMPFATAIKVSELIGVGIEELAAALEQQQREYKRKRAKLRAKPSADGPFNRFRQ